MGSVEVLRSKRVRLLFLVDLRRLRLDVPSTLLGFAEAKWSVVSEF